VVGFELFQPDFDTPRSAAATGRRAAAPEVAVPMFG
jgi:hypothetical protein